MLNEKVGGWRLAVGGWRSAVGGRRSAVGGRRPAASLQFKAGWSAEQNFLDLLLFAAELLDLDTFSSRTFGS
jgi:hypothetical protein